MKEPLSSFHTYIKEGSERYDQETIQNLINGVHDPNDRLPYSMLIKILRGRDHALELLASNQAKGNKSFIRMAEQYVLLHHKVIYALCRHYDESRPTSTLED